MKFLQLLLFFSFAVACSTPPGKTVENDSADENVNRFTEGKTIFLSRCASCHMVNKEMTGPALRGVEDRWPDKQKLFAFIRNSEELIKTDTYAHNLWMQYNQTMMNKHPDLTNAQIEQVLGYIKSVSVHP